MEIKVLGTGCSKCHTLNKRVMQAIEEMNITAEYDYVQDIEKLMELNVLQTPALMIDNAVILSGKVPTVKEIKKILEESL